MAHGPVSLFLSACRFGSRTDALSGRKGRRLPMFSAPRGRCSQHRACLSSLPRPPWRTACAPSTPTTLAGPRGCRGSPSCSSRRPWVASRACHNPCHSAVWVQAHQIPWVSLTACPPTAPVCSPTSTSRISPECRPLSPAPRTYRAPRSCVLPRTVTCGEGQASRHCGAKRWSTQCPWVSLSDFSKTPHHTPLLLSPSPSPTLRLFFCFYSRYLDQNERTSELIRPEMWENGDCMWPHLDIMTKRKGQHWWTHGGKNNLGLGLFILLIQKDFINYWW